MSNINPDDVVVPTSLEDILAEMHVGVASGLLRKVKAGTITAAELAIARQFLRDNGISGVPASGTPIGDLADSLPTFDDEDDNIVPISRP